MITIDRAIDKLESIYGYGGLCSDLIIVDDEMFIDVYKRFIRAMNSANNTNVYGRFIVFGKILEQGPRLGDCIDERWFR